MKKTFVTAAAAIYLWGSALPASALVGRDDIDDAAYVNAAVEGYDFVAAIPSLGGQPNLATGILIAPQWVLTAGHVADGMQAQGFSTVRLDRNYQVDNIIIHPEFYGEDEPNLMMDIALLHLTEPVEGIEPVALYRGSDENGQHITLVGYGDLGDASTGPSGSDGRARAGENIVDATLETIIAFRFDAPPAALPLEAVSAPGDSGGPALITQGEQLFVAGVSSSQDEEGGNGHPGSYGVIEYYVRVSQLADWIDSHIGN